MAIMTFREAADWIRQNVNHLDKIVLLTEKCTPPYGDGHIIDTAGNVYQHLLDPNYGFNLEESHVIRFGMMLL